MVDTREVQIAPGNAEQLKAWDGGEGDYWARNAGRYDASLARYHGRLLGAATIGAGDRVLDVGCGTGQTTRDAARLATTGSALGVDLSSQMLGVARSLAADEGVTNARFEQVDAQIHVFEDPAYDVAISRTGAMFFSDHAAAFANIGRALRPGGRLALLVWQELARNEWVVEFFTALSAGRDLPAPPPGAPGPFSLGDPDRVHRLLTGAGFSAPHLDSLSEPMYFGADTEDAFRFVLGQLGWMLEGLDHESRARASANLRASIDAHATADGVAYDSATWLVTAERGT
jgi:SAM-dependent methyltransferase